MFRATLALLAFSVAASASTITYNTVSGAQDAASDSVDASATIVINGTTVTVTLNNLQSGIANAGQTLSDLFFTLSATPTTALSTTTTPTGPLVTVAAGGVETTSNAAIDAWVLTSAGAIIHIDSLAGSGPSETIIGPTPSSSVNSSITGSTHNPFFNQQAVFTFTVAGINSDTTVTAAQFSFGTDAGDNVNGCIVGAAACTPSVPEPVSSALVGTGLVSLFFLRRRFVRS
ncbi:MAG TPA: PEP-CTERM sorting domain-containing protein [Bryobacteraceae bacterium]|jgi:hypothetical protein